MTVTGPVLAIHRAWRAGELTPNEFLDCLLASRLRHESQKVPPKVLYSRTPVP